MESDPRREINEREEEPTMNSTSSSSVEHVEAQSKGTTSESSVHNSPKKFTLRELTDATDNRLPESFTDRLDAYISTQLFSFNELSDATSSFHKDFILGVGGFAIVYKGRLKKTDQVVAVKRMDKGQEHHFMTELLMLNLLDHDNVINLIGYCAEGKERLLVYEHMHFGSLKDYLRDNRKQLDWTTRLKIAAGVARGVEYLHNTANPPVFHRDLKLDNILLDNEYLAKLSDFGYAKLCGVGSESNITMDSDYSSSDDWFSSEETMLKSDIQGFGLILLELIIGPETSIQFNSPEELARHMLKVDGKLRVGMVDQQLEHDYSIQELLMALDVACMCIRQEDIVISNVVNMLTKGSS